MGGGEFYTTSRVAYGQTALAALEWGEGLIEEVFKNPDNRVVCACHEFCRRGWQ